jgi:IclR family transcriptional regulator, KDG regulon repressor
MSDSVVKSARRVFEVLEMFDRERRSLSLKDVCAAFAYAPSSGAALLKSLVTLGYLDYDRTTRSYFPTMRIAFLGQWVQDALFGDGEALRLMAHLHAITGETIMLATQSDLYAQYIHAVHAGEPLQVAVSPGTLRPLASSGMGWLLLSCRSDADIEKMCRRIDIEDGKRVDRAALKRNIAAARRNGYVFSRHTVRRGTGIIAMLLPEGTFDRTFAIGIAGSVSQLERKQAAILDAMRRGIREFLPAQKAKHRNA